MLESLSIPRYVSASSRENVTGADNQQERPVGRARLESCRNGGKIDGGLAPEVSLPSCWNPQRLYARFQFRLEKIQSELHGDMQRVAEMSTPLRSGSFPQRLKPHDGAARAARLEAAPFQIKIFRSIEECDLIVKP